MGTRNFGHVHSKHSFNKVPFLGLVLWLKGRGEWQQDFGLRITSHLPNIAPSYPLTFSFSPLPSSVIFPLTSVLCPLSSVCRHLISLRQFSAIAGNFLGIFCDWLGVIFQYFQRDSVFDMQITLRKCDFNPIGMATYPAGTAKRVIKSRAAATSAIQIL